MSHPFQIKTSIPYSQTLKVCRLKTQVSCLREMFLVRGYFKKAVNGHRHNVAFGKNQSGIKISEIIIPFVAAIYNPKV